MVRMLAEARLDLDIQADIRQMQAGVNDAHQLACQQRRPLGAGGMQNDQELVGRQARHQVCRVDVLAQASRDFAQGFVPHRVSQDGIDLAHIAHLQDYQREGLRGIGQEAVDVVLGIGTVGQSGQGILIGHAAQPCHDAVGVPPQPHQQPTGQEGRDCGQCQQFQLRYSRHRRCGAHGQCQSRRDQCGDGDVQAALNPVHINLLGFVWLWGARLRDQFT